MVVFHMYLMSRTFFDRDARGMTPFMLAVSGRAYPAAITVLEAAQKMAKGISSISFHLETRVSFELKMCVWLKII